MLDDKASAEVLNEMTFGLQLAIGAKVLTEVNATSGIQTQAYSTSMLTTLRKGLTKRVGYATRTLVLHSVNWEDAELALASSRRGRAPEPALYCGQPSAHHLHGDALIVAVGEVEDVAGNQLDGLDSRARFLRVPHAALWGLPLRSIVAG